MSDIGLPPGGCDSRRRPTRVESCQSQGGILHESYRFLRLFRSRRDGFARREDFLYDRLQLSVCAGSADSALYRPGELGACELRDQGRSSGRRLFHRETRQGCMGPIHPLPQRRILYLLGRSRRGRLYGKDRRPGRGVVRACACGARKGNHRYDTALGRRRPPLYGQRLGCLAMRFQQSDYRA